MYDDLFPQLETSLFIVTYGRSGSTLLQNLLNDLPGYAIRGENGNMLGWMVRCWCGVRDSGLGARMRYTAKVGRPFSLGPDHPWFGYEQIDVEKLGRELAEVFLRNVLRPDPETRVIGFKEIRWHEDPALFQPMMEFLQRYMPRARFIFNTRDHEDVRHSGWWDTMPREEVMEELERAEALFSAWQVEHPGDWLAMKYNEYAAEPEAWRPLFEFLGEPFDAALVQRVLDRKLVHMKESTILESGGS